MITAHESDATAALGEHLDGWQWGGVELLAAPNVRYAAWLRPCGNWAVLIDARHRFRMVHVSSGTLPSLGGLDPLTVMPSAWPGLCRSVDRIVRAIARGVETSEPIDWQPISDAVHSSPEYRNHIRGILDRYSAPERVLAHATGGVVPLQTGLAPEEAPRRGLRTLLRDFAAMLFVIALLAGVAALHTVLTT